MQEALVVKQWRGRVLENYHTARAVVITAKGDRTLTLGPSDCAVPVLGCAHPFQTAAILESPSRPVWIKEEAVALSAGRSDADIEQLSVLRDLLLRSGLSEESMQCGPRGPRHPSAGFHGLLLATEKAAGKDPRRYKEEDSLVQRITLDGVLRMVRRLRTELEFVPDDCSLPSPCLELASLAGLYARLADGSTPGVSGLLAAIRTRPSIFAAPGSFEADLYDASQGDLVIRTAENGLCCASVLSRGWGIAVKVDAYSERLSRIALLALIRHLHVLPCGRADSLYESMAYIRNACGDRCGKLEALVS